MTLYAGHSVAQLPMYDWPEFTQATNRLWASICNNLRKVGIDAPTSLDRMSPPAETWQSPELLLSQTCGLPLVADLSEKVKVLGSFAYQGIEPAGSYHSVIITQGNNNESSIRLEGKRAVSTAMIPTRDALHSSALSQTTARVRAPLSLFLSAAVTATHFAPSQAAALISRQSTASVGIWQSNARLPSRVLK